MLFSVSESGMFSFIFFPFSYVHICFFSTNTFDDDDDANDDDGDLICKFLFFFTRFLDNDDDGGDDDDDDYDDDNDGDGCGSGDDYDGETAEIGPSTLVHRASRAAPALRRSRPKLQRSPADGHLFHVSRCCEQFSGNLLEFIKKSEISNFRKFQLS